MVLTERQRGIYLHLEPVTPVEEGLVLDHVTPVEEGLVLDHDHCQNRRCANFMHLEPVTPVENLMRAPD